MGYTSLIISIVSYNYIIIFATLCITSMLFLCRNLSHAVQGLISAYVYN